MVVGRRRVCAYWPKEPQVPPLRLAPVEKHSQERTAGPQISPLRCAPVEMTKGRAALPLSVVAEQKLFFITLGGPTAHDFSGRDANFICARKVFNEEFLPPTIELSSRPKESWVVDPPKGMKNVYPATTLAGSAVLPF